MLTSLLFVASLAHAQAVPTRQLAARDGANLQRPTWSPDGKKLSFEANYHEKQSIELFQGDPKTGSFMKVVPAVRSASASTAGFSSAKGGMVAQELDWAPASVGRFVYAASNDLLDYDLYIGGGGALASAPGADGGAQWSPNGRYISFTSARTGQGDLYLIDTQTIEAAPKRLSNDADASELFASWASDSQRLVFVGHSDRGDNLWILPSLIQTPVRLTDWARSQVRPSWSPTADKIAFYANHDEESRFDLYVVDAVAGATPTLLVKDVKLNAAGPTWTPDGKNLVIVVDDDERYDPIVAVNASDSTKVKTLDLGTVGNGDLDVATVDGKLQIAWAAQGKKSDKDRSFDRIYVADLPILP